MKAKSKVSPQQVKDAYQHFAESQGSQKEWKYRVISLKGDDDKTLTHNTEELSSILKDRSWEEAQDLLETFKNTHENTPVSVSNSYRHGEKQISPAYQEALSQLEPGLFSSPQTQISRSTGKPVYRIFFLESILENPTPSFDSTQRNLEQLVNQEVFNQEFSTYLNNLRQRYGVTEQLTAELVPSTYKPFILR